MSLLVQPEMKPTESLLGKFKDAIIGNQCKKEAKQGKLSNKCVKRANRLRRERSRTGVNRKGKKK